MMDKEPRVYIMKSKLARGGVCHYLRWVDPVDHRWKSHRIGPDAREAERERAVLEKQLKDGSYRSVNRVTWEEFVREHLAKTPGLGHRRELQTTLNEFGRILEDPPPHKVTYRMVEHWLATLKANGNGVATRNKKLRNLRAAFNKAVDRGYVATSPVRGHKQERENAVEVREVLPDEERALVAAADELYGLRMRMFVELALATGGRRSELLGLTWDRIDLEARLEELPSVLFTMTKGKRDRRVNIDPALAADLLKLKAMTLQAGGPFRRIEAELGEPFETTWAAICRKAGVAGVWPHDLRRTFVTRLIRQGVALPTVQALAGHANIRTTLAYYNRVSRDDMRAAVRKLWRSEAAG